MEKITAYLIQSTVHTHEVRAWQEDILLPTYEIGEEEKNPIFLEKRVYQGSCGSVYPYPVVEKISDEKKDKLYHAFFIENEYIKVMILPELGGRVHMAYDKVKNRHFVYYNQVVKPALVGLTGPWISGGIEFNWPQHHRPSTFLPTDCSIEEHADGSKTIWCSEVERMFRTKGMQGFRLYPGKSYIEIEVKVYNRTVFPQTFLWWANPAVVVNDHYHSVFPPDVNAVFDHGKRDVSSFPIATGVYYKQDYSAGVDISKYKNIPVPTSYMAIRSKFDFVGGYEEHIGAGLLHVADHHVSPGKKQWTWGNGDFGQAWDRNLTDEDGPYIELMTGVYTDNQPDFTWLQPYEEKSWKQYFMPYSEVGYVKNATKDAVLHVSVAEGNGKLILYTTSEMKNVCVKVVSVKTGQVLLEETIARIAPEAPYAKVFEAPEVADADMKTVVLAADGVKLLEYQADQPEIKPVPDPARAAKDPKDIASIEQLFLTGLHLEQYRHATYNPLDYYEEALRREPGDVRCNNAVGLWLMRKGQFAKAEPYFKKAIETLTERNPNPYDGEPYYNLGWCCEMQGRYDDAYDAFYKSAWNAAWQDAAYYAVARIDTRKGAYERALEEVERSLVRNWHNHKARQLKATLLRKLGRKEEALAWVNASLELDRFNMGCAFEKMLLLGGNTGLESEGMMLRRTAHDYLEYAFDFMGAGLYQEAFDLLSMYEKAEAAVYPMVYYALGYCCCQMGDSQQGCAYYAKGEQADHRYCFPNKLEEVLVLQAVVDAIEASWALYCLGNFWYASRQYAEATQCWEEAGRLNENIPTVWRNLSLVYYNKQGNVEKALEALEKAYQLDEQDGRILMELDQLYKRLGRPYAERLALLEKHLDLVDVRDDLAIERITLYNQLGRFEEARQLIAARRFHPWEGGEGKITGQYAICHTELAKQAITAGNYREALDLLNATNVYPHNLGEGKLINAEENDIWYYKGLAYRGLQQEDEAVKWFKMAVTGSSEPQQAFFYNDQQPDKIFYQGLAWRALGQEDKARSCFNKLIAHGEKHLFDTCRIDYFAVSLPDLAIWEDDLNKRNRIHCEYVMGLGYMGLGEVQTAARWLNEVHRLDINHQGVQLHLNLLTHPVG